MQDRQPRTDCCAVVLAGGLNSRMGGRNKAFLKVGGRTIVDRSLSVLSGFFEEILLVTRQPTLYQDLGVKVVEDIIPARSSLTGIHAGLKQAAAPYAFVVPCDAPFLSSRLVALLLEEMSPDWDVVVPAHEDHFEPLCAIYAKRCLPFIEAQLAREDFKIIRFFPEVRVKKIPVSRLQQADPELLSFFNVNTPEAHRACQKLSEEN